MIYISFRYYLIVAAMLILFYALPLKRRWCVLLAANVVFWLVFCRTGWPFLLGTIMVSYLAAVWIYISSGVKKKVLLAGAVILVIGIWLFLRNESFMRQAIPGAESLRLLAPLGISFYTMQIIAYLTDVYRGDIAPQKNPAKYALFITFFPQLLQGPIPRYRQLGEQLFCGHLFDERKFTRGFYLIIWGFFLKLVIADKASVVVDTVFDNYPAYSGGYLWFASILYSIQLYADFLACTTLAQGVSFLFGIELAGNFKRPYFAVSVKDFWQRWHISLSSWLRDYVYIPLGGNRKGKGRKYLNLAVTFLASGIWHGAGLTYLLWGGIHGCCQIMGECLDGPKEKIYARLNIRPDGKGKRIIKQTGTFLIVSLAWVIFRAGTPGTGISMIVHMVSDFNPWIFFNDRIFTIGLAWKEMLVLLFAVLLLFVVEKKQEEGIRISECIGRQKLPVRWLVCMAGICAVMIFGTYGFGFEAQDFIYGGF